MVRGVHEPVTIHRPPVSIVASQREFARVRSSCSGVTLRQPLDDVVERRPEQFENGPGELVEAKNLSPGDGNHRLAADHFLRMGLAIVEVGGHRIRHVEREPPVRPARRERTPPGRARSSLWPAGTSGRPPGHHGSTQIPEPAKSRAMRRNDVARYAATFQAAARSLSWSIHARIKLGHETMPNSRFSPLTR